MCHLRTPLRIEYNLCKIIRNFVDPDSQLNPKKKIFETIQVRATDLSDNIHIHSNRIGKTNIMKWLICPCPVYDAYVF